MLMPSTLERRLQPNLHDIQCRLDIDHALAREITFASLCCGKPRRFLIPTKSAANAFDPVGHIRLAVARATQNDAALKFMSRHRLSHRLIKSDNPPPLRSACRIGDAMPRSSRKSRIFSFGKETPRGPNQLLFHACLPPKHGTPNSPAPVPTSPTLTEHTRRVQFNLCAQWFCKNLGNRCN